MGSRIIPGKEECGLISYRDQGGNWNKLQLKPNAELAVGQIKKRNPGRRETKITAVRKE